ncbi:hypothetical protein K7432_005832 [Basidiobolus ranarum]|uniref:Carboxypeptidase n=1 Tax=Basidiobolus ranarum TaxID=34480 RepID=A0ABR2WVV8_9FUNG
MTVQTEFSLLDELERTFGMSPASKELQETQWISVATHESLEGYALRVKQPQLCDSSVKQYSGYLDIAQDKHFFFWFFESRSKPKKDPIILWLNGGPGCSSFTGLLMELGPCRVKKDGSGTEFNPHSWNSNANVIFLDQPTNVGYSHGSKTYGSLAASKDVYAFLQLFFKEYPEYSKQDFHVFGESYGGHYVPAIAKTIHENNKKGGKKFKPIKLKSIGLGNGLTDPLTQYKYYPKMACDNSYGIKAVSQSSCRQMEQSYPKCANMIRSCYDRSNSMSCVPPTYYCNQNLIQPFQSSGLNIYDIRTKCEPGAQLCYSILNGLTKYLNRPEIMSELGAEVKGFKSCDTSVYFGFLMAGDWMKPYHLNIPELLEDGIRVLVYAGDADFICNWYGNKAWAMELDWSGKKKFNNAKDTNWTVHGEPAGEVRTAKGLTFLRVFEAGHMVPYDQPENALDMINRWIQKSKF